MKPPPNPRRHLRILLAACFLCLSLHAAAQMPQLLNYQGRVASGGTNFDGTGQFKFSLVDGGTNVSRTATGTLTINSGFVTAATVTDGGTGYTEVPRVYVRDRKGGGTGALVIATIAGGAVTALQINDPGSGYTSFAYLEIVAPPPQMVYQTHWSNAPDIAPADGEPDAAISLPVTKGLYSVLLGDTSRANMAALPAGVFANPDVRLRVWFNDGTHGFQQLAPDARIAAVGYAMMAETVPDGAIGTAKIAAGAVGATQLADGAVTSTHIAAGAIQSSNIAAGAITATQLAKPPQAGSVAFGDLDFRFTKAFFRADFVPPFASKPIVTFSQLGGDSSSWKPVVNIRNATAFGFDGEVGLPAEIATVTASASSLNSKLLRVNGLPIVVYVRNSDKSMWCCSALDAQGKTWRTPQLVDASVPVGGSFSVVSLGSRIGVSYSDMTNRDLRYVRSTDSLGLAWATPVILHSAGNVGDMSSLAMIGGYPAIAYTDDSNDDLRFIRATDAEGVNAWSASVPVATEGNVGAYPSLAEVDGRPAIAYQNYTANTLAYVRATNSQGSMWGSPVSPFTGASYYPDYITLAVVEGNPVITFRFPAPSTSSPAYVRATNTTGSTWGSILFLGDWINNNGRLCQFEVVRGKPVILYLSIPTTRWRYAASADTIGGSWTVGEIVTDGEAGALSLGVVDGNPAFLRYRSDPGQLELVRQPDLPTDYTIQWIALEP